MTCFYLERLEPLVTLQKYRAPIHGKERYDDSFNLGYPAKIQGSNTSNSLYVWTNPCIWQNLWHWFYRIPGIGPPTDRCIVFTIIFYKSIGLQYPINKHEVTILPWLPCKNTELQYDVFLSGEAGTLGYPAKIQGSNTRERAVWWQF